MAPSFAWPRTRRLYIIRLTRMPCSPASSSIHCRGNLAPRRDTIRVSNTNRLARGIGPDICVMGSRTNSVDVHVGLRVKARRQLSGMTQGQVAKRIGITFQQLQKNENGQNRIGASRLFALSDVLAVPVAYFFEGLHAGRTRKPRIDSNDGTACREMAMASRETLKVVRAYYSIKQPKIRHAIVELIRTVAAAYEPPKRE